MKINTDIFEKRMKKLEDLPQDAIDKTYPQLKKETPIRSGNARNKTKQNRLKIKSNYPYAGRLDEGWSRQAPKGFTEPSIEYLDKTIQEKVGKI